jgi:hypothetical protein
MCRENHDSQYQETFGESQNRTSTYYIGRNQMRERMITPFPDLAHPLHNVDALVVRLVVSLASGKTNFDFV